MEQTRHERRGPDFVLDFASTRGGSTPTPPPHYHPPNHGNDPGHHQSNNEPGPDTGNEVDRNLQSEGSQQDGEAPPKKLVSQRERSLSHDALPGAGAGPYAARHGEASLLGHGKPHTEAA